MTTSLPPNDPSDEVPLHGEAELSALYRQLPRNEPGATLDSAVLHAAARAIGESGSPHAARRSEHRESAHGSRNRSLPKTAPVRPVHRLRKPPRWLVTLGTAAMLMLAGSIAWHMRDVSRNEVAPVSSRAADGSANAALRKSATPPVDHAENPSPPPPMPARRIVPASPRIDASDKKLARDRTISTQRMNAAAAPMMEKATQATGNPPKTGTHDAAGIISAPQHPMAARRSGTPLTVAPRTAAAAAAKQRGTLFAPLPAPPAPPSPRPVQEASADLIPPAPPAPQAAPRLVTPMKAAVQATSPAQVRELDAIRQLFATHQDGEGQRRLLQFRRSYPRYPLPPDLRAQLPKP